jgi:hypothetical protein
MASLFDGMVAGSGFVPANLFSYGATVARLILVQKIVVRIHVGKHSIHGKLIGNRPLADKGEARLQYRYFCILLF